MKKIFHQELMAKNKLEKTTFSENLQKKISIFDKMYSGIQKTGEEDQKKWIKELKELDHEIHENMLDELEADLQDNDILEEKQEQKKQEKNVNQQQKPDAKKEVSDESILDKLYSMKRTESLGRSTLKDLGIKTPISRSEIRIGKYLLKRTSFFQYKYRLQKVA